MINLQKIKIHSHAEFSLKDPTTHVTVKPLILATLNFGVWVNLIILDPVIFAFLLPTTLKR